MPRAILEGALEPAVTARLQILDLAIRHVSSLEEAIVDRFPVWKVQLALAMPLVHLVDLTVVCGPVAIADVFDGEPFKRVDFVPSLAAPRALLAGAW